MRGETRRAVRRPQPAPARGQLRGRRAPLHRRARRRPRRDLRPRRRDRRLHPRARRPSEQLWLALAFAYMVVITGICLVAQADVVRYRAAAAGPRGRQDRLLARLARLLPLRPRRLHLPAQLPRRRLPGAARALALVARRPGRPPAGARLKARAGAVGRRAAHPERDLRGDGARARRPARGRARGRRLRAGRPLPRSALAAGARAAPARRCGSSSGCPSPGASAASTSSAREDFLRDAWRARASASTTTCC